MGRRRREVQWYSPLSLHNSVMKIFWLLFLGRCFWLKILSQLIMHYAVSRLVMVIDPKIFRIILGLIVGGALNNFPSSHLPMENKVRYIISSTHVKLRELFSSPRLLIQFGSEIFIPYSPEPNRGRDLHPIFPWDKSDEACPHHILIYPYNSGW